MDNKTKQGFYSTCLTHFDPLLTRVWPCLSTNSLFIHENRVQSSSPLYFPPLWTNSVAYVSWSLFSWRENEVFTRLWTMTYPRKESALDILKWICNHRVGKAGSCCPVRFHRFQEPPPLQASLPACFGIPEQAGSPSSTSHSAPWARSSLKLQQTFILELRNSDLCLSGCFDRKRTWGLTRDRSSGGGRRRRVYLRPAKINFAKFLVSLCWSFRIELVQWRTQCIPVPTLSSLEEGQLLCCHIYMLKLVWNGLRFLAGTQ